MRSYTSLKELKIFLEIMKRKIGVQKTREIFKEFKQEQKKLQNNHNKN